MRRQTGDWTHYTHRDSVSILFRDKAHWLSLVARCSNQSPGCFHPILFAFRAVATGANPVCLQPISFALPALAPVFAGTKSDGVSGANPACLEPISFALRALAALFALRKSHGVSDASSFHDVEKEAASFQEVGDSVASCQELCRLTSCHDVL